MDDKCQCETPPITDEPTEPTQASTTEIDIDLICKVCSGTDGLCQDQNDNGDSKTCPKDQICAYFKDNFDGQTTFTRKCEADPGQECILNEEEGVRHPFYFFSV